VKKQRPKRSKKLFWLLIDLAVAAFFLAMLFYRPARYNPQTFPGDNKVSKYLTHDLMPQLYNGADSRKPFDLIVTQQGINDIIAHYDWPYYSDYAAIAAPQAFFSPDGITIIGAVTFRQAEFIVTVVIKPALDSKGLLNLNLSKMNVGAMNLTLLAKIIASKMYQQRVSAIPIASDDIRAKIAASLLNGEPFDPVFEIKDIFEKDDKALRIRNVTLHNQKIILHLIPIN
jgi:hypothetical protein